MRVLFTLVAAATLASGAVAGPVDSLAEAEKAAPIADCLIAVLDGVEWCFVKVRFPNGSLVSTATRIKDGKPVTGGKLLSGPEKAALP